MEGKISTLIFTLMLCVAVTHAGVSYIRWGRSTCPDTHVLLYKGYVAGHNHLAVGGGGNYLCVSQSPQFQRGVAGLQDYSGRLGGVEVELNAAFNPLFLTDNLAGAGLHNQDLLCARCHDPNSWDVFMLPGRLDCDQSKYELAYKGYLMSEMQYPGFDNNEFICVDEAPEGRQGGSGDDNQGTIYPVQVDCGSLPCNPFTTGLEMTCAVCVY